MNAIQLKIAAPDGTEELKTFDKDEVKIGRVAGNDIAIKDKDISRYHCSIVRQRKSWLIHDLKSTNGTFINGMPVEQRQLHENDLIIVGNSRLLVVRMGELVQPPADTGPIPGQQGDEAVRVIYASHFGVDSDWLENSDVGKQIIEGPERIAEAFALLAEAAPIFNRFTDNMGLDPEKIMQKQAETVLQRVMEIFAEVEFGELHWMDLTTNQLIPLASHVPDSSRKHSIQKGIRYYAKIVQRDGVGVIAELSAERTGSTQGMQVLCAPLCTQNECRGVLVIGNDGKVRAKAMDLELLCGLGAHAAAGLYNQQAICGMQERVKNIAVSFDRQDLSRRELIDRERVSQLNTIAQSNVLTLEHALKRINEKLQGARGSREGQLNKRLAEAARETEAALAHCQTLLTYTRRGKIHIARFLPTQLLAEVMILTQGILGDNIWLEADIPDKLPLIEFDVVIFEQILIRLILIVRDAMMDGGMLRICALEAEMSADFANIHGVEPGPALHFILETTGHLELNMSGLTSDAAEYLYSINSLKDIVRYNKGVLEIDKSGETNIINLFLPLTRIKK
ncbi:FHA domain-containing protein [Candidatus Sumerlaeota bacterium]|nr:FHA domain-containing protein [Candidatus Sumerlaeota bacterium]